LLQAVRFGRTFEVVGFTWCFVKRQALNGLIYSFRAWSLSCACLRRHSPCGRGWCKKPHQPFFKAFSGGL